MRFEFFRVPVGGGDEAAALNRFLAAHRVLSVERQFIADGPNSAWAVCVSYSPREAAPSAPRKKIDYRQVLPPAQFEVFARLRALRKTLSEKEGVPPYALFNNEQLAEMVRRPVRSLDQMGAIDGVGPARLKKYGAAFLRALDPASGNA